MPYRASNPGDIARMIMSGGAIQAHAVRAGGEAWGGAFRDIGSMVSGKLSDFLQEKQRQKEVQPGLEQTRKQAALLEQQARALEDAQEAAEFERKITRGLRGLFAGDEMPTLKDLIDVGGPERGLGIFQGIHALESPPTHPTADDNTTRKYLRDVFVGFSALPEEVRAEYYQLIRARVIDSGAVEEKHLPKDYDTNWVTATANYGVEPEQGTRTVQTMQDGQPVTSIVPDVAGTSYPNQTVAPTLRGIGAVQWATNPETGEVELMTPEEIRAGGGQQPPTADMRNKKEGRRLVKNSISAIQGLSEKIITKIGPAQRADAVKRGVEAVWGTDPEFRTYQDARMALAGNLAVAQQGSRPSDADIKAIWLPLVPDAYRDTAESSAMKWELIRTMSNVDDSGEAGWETVGDDIRIREVPGS